MVPEHQVSNDRTASAELHYTDFGDAETFEELCRRHSLTYAGTTDHNAWNHIWISHVAGEPLTLMTAVDPRDSDSVTMMENGDRESRTGYCSYVSVAGPMPFALHLYEDVIETAAGIKGEFKPLTDDESGEVYGENWRGRDGL